MKVKNKKVITDVAVATYKGNKKRNLLTIVAITLTTFLITVVIALGTSYWDTLSTRQIRMSGMDYDIELSEPREDQVAKIRKMDTVQYAGIQVKCGLIREYKEQALGTTRMYWIDQTAWHKQMIPALESYQGEYPKKENELMLSSSALDAMGIKKPTVGMSITLKYNTLNKEEFKEFKLAGYFKDYTGTDRAYVSQTFYEQTGIKQTDFGQGLLKITLQSSLYSEKDIMKMQNQIQLDKQYLSADYDSISSFMKTLFGLLAMLLMIFLSGYLFVFNTLYISITKDIQYYGQLKTLGMTSKQLKSIVYKQAIWNSCFGIPLGLLLGMFVGIGIIPQIIHIADENIAMKDIVQVQPWIYVIAAVFAFMTNLVSSSKPAKMVGACSPVEAMKFLNSQKRAKKHKTIDTNIRRMAIQNMFRDKKQAFIIILSFVIAVSIFLTVNVVILGNNTKTLLNKISDQDIQFINQTMLDDTGAQNVLTDSRIRQVKKVKGVKSVSVVTSMDASVPYQEDVYQTYLKKVYASRYSPGNYEKDISEYKAGSSSLLSNVRLIGIDALEFKKINDNLGGTLDKQGFENGEYAIIENFFGNGKNDGMKGKITKFSLSPNKDALHSIKIGAVIFNSSAEFSGGYLPSIVVSDQYASKLTDQMETELINVIYENPFDKACEKQVKAIFKEEKKVSSKSKLDRYDDMKQTETQVKILGNSIGIIMALLAILNYINMMVASVQNRSVEFATLESIGMTTKQHRHVLLLEGLGYAIISILLSLLIATPLSYLVFESMNTYRIAYEFPWLYNTILVIIICILCMVIPVYTYHKTQKGSIVERLRDIAK